MSHITFEIELNQFFKYYFIIKGENPKILGIADGFGVAEDPNGLNSAGIFSLYHRMI